MKKSKAYCTECAIKIAQESKEKSGGLILLETAYKTEKEKAQNQDLELDLRTKTILQQMDVVKD